MNYLGPYTSEDDNIEVLTVFQAFEQSEKYKDIKISYNKGVDIQSQSTDGMPSQSSLWNESLFLFYPGIASAVAAAQEADAVVLVIGDSLKTCGEWTDNDNLDPPGMQLDLVTQVVDAVKSSNIPVVLVLVNGRQFTFAGQDPSNAVLDDIDLLINSYRPGQMGGVALRDVIMGDAENSGINDVYVRCLHSTPCNVNVSP